MNSAYAWFFGMLFLTVIAFLIGARNEVLHMTPYWLVPISLGVGTFIAGAVGYNYGERK